MSRISFFIFLAVFLAVLGVYASPDKAAPNSDLDFWAGLGDGFIALLALLASPVVEVNVFDRYQVGNAIYLVGYYVGTVLFTLGAGVAALPKF